MQLRIVPSGSLSLGQPERTARMLRAQHQYEILKALDLWPYGDLGEEEKKP